MSNSSISNACSCSKESSGSGMTTLIISKEEMKDIMKIVKSPEQSGLLVKGVSVTIESEAKEKVDISACC